MEKKFSFTPTLFMRCLYNVLIAYGCTKNPDLNLKYFIINEDNGEKLIGTDFQVFAVPSFGGSEGIYLDVYLEGWNCFERVPADHKVKIKLATAKTLKCSLKTMEAMGKLAADIIWYGNEIANKYIYAFAPEEQNPMCVSISDPDRWSVPMRMNANRLKKIQGRLAYLQNPCYNDYIFYDKTNSAILLTLSKMEPYADITKAVKAGRFVGLRNDASEVTVWEPMMLNDPELELFALLPENNDPDLGKSMFLSYEKLDRLLTEWAANYFGAYVRVSVGVEKYGEAPYIFANNFSETHGSKLKNLFEKYEEVDEFREDYLEYGVDLPLGVSLGIFAESLKAMDMPAVGTAIGINGGVIFTAKSI